MLELKRRSFKFEGMCGLRKVEAFQSNPTTTSSYSEEMYRLFEAVYYYGTARKKHCGQFGVSKSRSSRLSWDAVRADNINIKPC